MILKTRTDRKNVKIKKFVIYSTNKFLLFIIKLSKIIILFRKHNKIVEIENLKCY